MGDDRLDQKSAPRHAPGRGVLPTTLLALLFVSLASWLVWDRLAERYRRDLAEAFSFESAEMALRIEERFRGYRQVLRGARALFAASASVERGEWHEYVSGLKLEEDYRGIQGLGFARWIPAETLERRVETVRGDGYPGYRVWPPGEREAYSAIEMLEPFDWRNQRAFGFDMYSEPVRRHAMERAVDAGQSALSGKVTLVQETTEHRQAGVLLYMPVYEGGAPTDTREARWRALVGWVYSPFRMDDLMPTMLGRYPEAVRVRVFDQEQAEESLLYDSHSRRQPVQATGLAREQRVTLDGRDWILLVEALPGYAATVETQRIELVAIVLVGLMFVVATASFMKAREREKALGRATESLRRSEARYSALVNLAHEGIAATDADFRLTFANPRMAEMLGAPAGELSGRLLDEFWSDSGPAASRAQILARLRAGVGSRYEVEIVRKDSRHVTALISDAPLTDEAGHFKGAILMIADISDRKEAERRIEHLATHDPLTGVPNRLKFNDLLGQTVALARRYAYSFALLFVDLDRFKEVNDGCGHLIGDRLLVEAVKRMQGCIRVSDTLSRQGGDEFVVLLPQIESGADAEVVAEKIRAALALPFTVDGHELSISSSIGIVLYPQHGEDEDTLLRHADEAMYRAKSAGRNCSRYYST